MLSGARNDAQAQSSSCWILSFQVLHPRNLTFDAVGPCYVSQGSRVSDRKMAANEFADRSSASVLVPRKCALRRAHARGARNDAQSTIIILLDPEFPMLRRKSSFDAVGACYVSQGSRVSDRKMAANVRFADRSSSSLFVLVPRKCTTQNVFSRCSE
jgi:hypothetical protein